MKGGRSIYCLQFTSVDGVDPFFSFNSPFCLNLPGALVVESAFSRTQTNNFLLNGGKAHAGMVD